MKYTQEAMAEAQQNTERIRERSVRFRKMLNDSYAAFSGGIIVASEPEKKHQEALGGGSNRGDL